MSNPVVRRKSSGFTSAKKLEEEEEDDIIPERLIEYIAVIGPQDEEDSAAGKEHRKEDDDERSRSPAPPSPLGQREESSLQLQDEIPPAELQQQQQQKGRSLDAVNLSQALEENGTPVMAQDSFRSLSDREETFGSIPSIVVMKDSTGANEGQPNGADGSLAPQIGSPQFMEKFGSTFWFEEPVCSLQLVKPTLGEDVRILASFFYFGFLFPGIEGFFFSVKFVNSPMIVYHWL